MIEFFLRNAKFTAMLSVIVAVGGMIGMAHLNSESWPAVDFAMVTVETNYPGAAPEDVEAKITKPIEDKIREVSGLKDVRSVSQSGKSKIFIRVDMDNVDVDEVIGDLEKAVNQVSGLPNDLLEDPSFTEMKSEEFPAIEIALIGSNDARRRDLVADLLKEDLEDNKRIKNVIFSGFTKREFMIELDQQKMARHHIGVTEVLNRIGRRNIDLPGGDLEANSIQKLVRIKAKVQDANELQNMLLRSNFSGQRVYLKDVAKVSDHHEKPRYYSQINGKEATLLIVNKKAGADTLKLVEDVDSIIERYRNTYKGEMELVVYNNEAEKVKNRLSILSSNALSGLVLVIVFLFIFLPGKIGAMASMSLPLAMMATFGLMPSLGVNLDAITILSLVIALGMLVDNSVVISENFARLKKMGMDSMDAALEATKPLALPITATAMTTIAAFLPMLVTRGIMGEFIKWIPIIVTLSLVASLLESFFFLPLRLKFAGDYTKAQTEEEVKNEWFERIVTKFENLSDTLINHRYKVAVGFMGLLMFSFAMMGVANKFMLFPPDQTEIYLARYKAPKGASLEKTHELAGKLVSEVERVAGQHLRAIVTKTGSSKFDPMDPKGKEGDDAGVLILYATDDAKVDIKESEMLPILRQAKTDGFDEVTFEAQVNGPPTGAPINVTFRSNDVKKLDKLLATMIEKLSSEPGVQNLRIDDEFGDDEVFVDVNYERADQLGLSVEDIGNTVRTGLEGTVASQVILANKEVDLRVKLGAQDRERIRDLGSLSIMDARGNLVPLSKVASFREEAGTPVVKRFDFKRAKTLTGDIDTTKTTSHAANLAVQRVFDEVGSEYPEVSLVFGGEEENTKESMQSLGDAMVLAMMGIFALLVFVFKSYLKPFIIMSTIPLGLVGFSVAFFFHGRPISFLAMVGIVGLAGIIVNSGIVLMSFIEQMREEGKLDLHSILVKASGMRLRAVVVTSLTTVSGLFPTAYGIGGTSPILVPMTLAMAWGLTSGTILTLLWVPCAYAILEDFNDWVDRRLGRSKPKAKVLTVEEHQAPLNGHSKGEVSHERPIA